MEKANIKKWDESQEIFSYGVPGDFDFSELYFVKRRGNFYFVGEGGANSVFRRRLPSDENWFSGGDCCLRVDTESEGDVNLAKLAIFCEYTSPLDCIEDDRIHDFTALDFLSWNWDVDFYVYHDLIKRYGKYLDGWTLDDFAAKGFDVF